MIKNKLKMGCKIRKIAKNYKTDICFLNNCNLYLRTRILMPLNLDI